MNAIVKTEALALVAPAVHELLAEIRTRGRRWDPVARTRPVSGIEEIYGQRYAAMMNRFIAMTAEDVNRFILDYELCYLNMTQGSASDESWNGLMHAVYLAVVLARRGYGSEHLDDLDEALSGMERAAERGSRTGAWRLDGDGMRYVREALNTLDAQLGIVPRGEMVLAIGELEIIMRRLGLIE